MRKIVLTILACLTLTNISCRESKVESLPAITSTLQVSNSVVGTTNGLNVVTATFSLKVMALSSNNIDQEFVVSGCTSNPSVATTMQMVGNYSVAVATLSGGNCSHGSTVTVELRLDRVRDSFGFLGSENLNPPPNPVVTYTIDTTMPVATMGNPTYPSSQSAIKNGDAASMSLSLTNAVSQSLTVSSGTTSAPPAGLAISTTGTAFCATIDITSPGLSGATILISDCTGDGEVRIGASAGIASSSGGVANVASSQKSVLVQNTPPTVTLSGVAPTGGADGSNSITATFSGLVKALSSSNVSGQVSVSGCSTMQPQVGIVMSDDGNGHSVATLNLSGGICGSAETVTVEVYLENIEDLAGNAGQVMDNPTPVTFVTP